MSHTNPQPPQQAEDTPMASPPQVTRTNEHESRVPLPDAAAVPQPQAPDRAMPDMNQWMRELEQREQALVRAERQLKARQMISSLGLPESVLMYLDLDSDQGLERSVHLADCLANAGSAPPAAPPPVPAFATYRDRAALYQQDQGSYRRMAGEGTALA